MPALLRTFLRTLLLASTLVLAIMPPAILAGQFDLHGPPGSGNFGSIVKVLPNGNIVITDPGFSPDNQANLGAVYLYSPSHVLISTLTGGGGGIFIVHGSDFVVCSPNWSENGDVYAGAVTWVDGTTGLNGEISASNLHHWRARRLPWLVWRHYTYKS